MSTSYWITIFTVLCFTVHAQVITVGTGGDYTTLASAASTLSPGDTVMILNGIYSDGTQFLVNVQGTANDPIIIKSEQAGQVIFHGGGEAIHITDGAYLELDGLLVEQQTANGINIDDGGSYASPSHHITVRNCVFRDMNAQGNNDLLKLSGLDDFIIQNCQFINGGNGGSGIDMVGCHRGIIEDNYFDASGVSGIQAKGGTQHILIRRNTLKNLGQRAVNLGGSTGLQFFRPPLGNPIQNAFEAADLEVYCNVFIGSWSPIAYVGCIRTKVYHNTIYQPQNWVIRILQETTEPGFLPCSNNEFINNIVYLQQDLTEVNIGPNTQPGTFTFAHNLWYNAAQSDGWSPILPVTDVNQVIADPLFQQPAQEDFHIDATSPAVGAGMNLAAPVTDFDRRLYLSPPSIGAYEDADQSTTAPYQVVSDGIIMGPNPAVGSVTIDGNFSQVSIEILNVQGQIVSDLSGSVAPLTISLTSLPAGMYFLRIRSLTHPKMWIERIIKSQ